MNDPSLKTASDISIEQELLRQANRKEKLIRYLPIIGLIGVIAFFTIVTKGQFIGKENLVSLLNQCFIMMIVISGGAFIYAIGGLDMAIGSVMALSAMLIAKLYNNGVPLILALLVGVGVCVLCMSITSISWSYLHVIPFIASMCVMNFCQGIVMYMVTSLGKETFSPKAAPWLEMSSTKILVLIIVLFVGYMVFTYTSFGKALRAIGDNPRVAKISGIHVERTIILAYIIIGVILALASLFSLSRSGIADNTVGNGMNLNVMTAVVLGGFPLEGGSRSRFFGPIIGALTVSCLTNGLGLMGQANALGFAIKGVLFLIVIGLTYDKSKGKLII